MCICILSPADLQRQKERSKGENKNYDLLSTKSIIM
jgi:hypothetical protein